MTRRSTICITPVKNEAWILDRFLERAAEWADHIVIADQGSDDGSADIASRHPKVHLVENPARDYDEAGRKRTLLDAARAIADDAILVALDADEMLTPNWDGSAEWDAVQTAPPGTVVRVEHVNVRPDRRTSWRTGDFWAMGFIDDGRSPPPEGLIHIPRVPLPAGRPELVLNEIKVLHLQYMDLARYRTKQRWYQCWERVTFPGKRPIQIYRQYHHMEAVPQSRLEPLPDDWIKTVDIETSEGPYRWDREVIDMLGAHGIGRFSKIDMWDDVDWELILHLHGLGTDRVADPRTRLEREVHQWLRTTQPIAYRKRVRYVQRALRLLGW